MPHHDCVVLGTGGVGSFVLAELATRGLRVVGVDRFHPPHDRGSSHGATRLIRLAYCEHPHYVPLLQRAFAAWEGLEERSPEPLFLPTPLLEAGPADSPLVTGVRRAAREHGLELEELRPEEVRRRFPDLRLASEHQAVLEPRAGVLRVEAAIAERLVAARALGAELRTATTAVDWEATDAGVRVRLEGGETLHAGHLVLAPGALAPPLLGELDLELRVLRKVLLWYEPTRGAHTTDAGFVPFAVQGSDGRFFYGFPALDGRGVKVAEHTGGESVGDPLAVDRDLRPQDREAVDAFVARTLPGLRPRPREHAVCLYTCTADGHFVLDRHPASPRVALVSGLSGHGFKFAPVLAEALADLVALGGTELPVGFLGLDRLARSRGSAPPREGGERRH